MTFEIIVTCVLVLLSWWVVWKLARSMRGETGLTRRQKQRYLREFREAFKERLRGL